jgi:hypothetical protein
MSYFGFEVCEELKRFDLLLRGDSQNRRYQENLRGISLALYIVLVNGEPNI